MSKKLFFILGSLVLLSCLAGIQFHPAEVRASDGYPVHNLDTGLNYAAIQSAIDAPETLDGHMILVDNGVYYENLLVNKRLSLIGESRESTVVDGNRTGNVINVTANDVLVSTFKIRNGRQDWYSGGIYITGCSGVVVQNNSIVDNSFGVRADGSYGDTENLTIDSNYIEGNFFGGVGLASSCNSNITLNNIENNGPNNQHAGIYLSNCINNTVCTNRLTNNWCGIFLEEALNTTITLNDIRANPYGGIYLAGALNNSIYHNTLINNTPQVFSYSFGTNLNKWDNGYPSGGNYWSELRSVDERIGPNQDQLGSDGIIDTPYIVHGNDTDQYPLTIPPSPISEYAYGRWIESPNYTPLGWRNITYIVIHVMDGYIDSAVNWFKNPTSNVSTHYLISQEGDIVQMVREKDIAWHAGNWAYNQQSIGIEHEDQGNWNTPNWVPEKLYQTSAALVRSLCEKYGIPKDRAHIIGHTEVPGVVKPCPGPYWDWGYFMGLVNETLTQRTFVARLDGTDYPLSVLSNSTASDFIFSQQPPQISINFTALSGVHGFCNLTIPKSLLVGSPWVIEINGNPLTNFTQTENMTHSFLSFTFTHSSTINVKVLGTWAIPEFSSFLILPIFMMATLLTVAVYRKKRSGNRQPADLDCRNLSRNPPVSLWSDVAGGQITS